MNFSDLSREQIAELAKIAFQNGAFNKATAEITKKTNLYTADK